MAAPSELVNELVYRPAPITQIALWYLQSVVLNANYVIDFLRW